VLVANNDGMAALQQMRLRLRQPIGDFIGQGLGVQFVRAFMQAAIRNKTMIFQIETVTGHSGSGSFVVTQTAAARDRSAGLKVLAGANQGVPHGASARGNIVHRRLGRTGQLR